jgi:hypothetical protein
MSTHPALHVDILADEPVDRMDAIEDAIDVHRRMLAVGTLMVSLHEQIKLRPTDHGLRDELDEACAQALSCAEQLRLAVKRYRNCT